MNRFSKLTIAVGTSLVMMCLAKSTPAQVYQVEIGTPAAPQSVPSAPPGRIFIPKSSEPQTVPAGQKFAAHTNVEIFVPNGISTEESPPFTGYGFETPASIGCRYHLVTSLVSGCNPTTATVVPTEPASPASSIAIVAAYDDPEAPSDLAYFSAQFGVPFKPSQFEVVWANDGTSSCPGYLGYGVPTDPTGGWEIEESLDVEWAHAMAPSATIYLVEACSNSATDMQQAVLVANNLVVCGQTEINSSSGTLGTCPSGSTGTGEVSMGWGAAEFTGENASDSCASLDDSCFTTPNIVYFAAAGDSPGVAWPGTSPNVVSVGGTAIRRNSSTFAFLTEVVWDLTGGGLSAIEAEPSYQSTYVSSVCLTTTNLRCVPDVAADADPYTGAYIYDSFPIDGLYDTGVEGSSWLIVGGTSLATPIYAGVVNNAATRNSAFAASTSAELTTMYTNVSVTTDFTKSTYGFCGPYGGTLVGTGYDLCTGIGTPYGFTGK